MTSNDNPVLNRLRETAAILGKPQSVVAANWLRRPVRMYSAARNLGMTRKQYDQGYAVVRRLAECAR
jgi:hypothetical protein